MIWEHSCGAVVFTRIGGEYRFVLVREHNGHYGFPKGHMERGETQRETALREIREEVGLHPRLLRGFRTETEYTLNEKRGVMKRVTFFLGEYRDETIVPLREELLEAPLVTYDRAMELFDHEDNKRILREAMEFLTREKSAQ